MRLADAADAAPLGAILSDWIDETPWMPRLHSRAEDQGFVAGLIDEEIVLRPASGPLGFVACRDGHIVALYVAQAARYGGIGRALVEKVQVENTVLTVWTVAQNVAARRFYAALGFAEIRRTAGENEEQLPDIFMEWRR